VRRAKPTRTMYILTYTTHRTTFTLTQKRTVSVAISVNNQLS